MREHPTLRVMIVGDNDSYGQQHPSGQPLREVMLRVGGARP